MWRNLFIQLTFIVVICNQLSLIHGIFRFPLGLPSFDQQRQQQQQVYVQPQQLIVYPYYQQTPIYQSSQNLFTPQMLYNNLRYVLQPAADIFNPIVSYIHQQKPFQASSYMNFNMNKKLFNIKSLLKNPINMDEIDESNDGVVIKSVEQQPKSDDNQHEQYKKKINEKMDIKSDNIAEATTILNIAKDENKENTKIPNYSEENLDKKN